MNPRTTGLLLIAALLLGAFVYVYEIREPDESAAGRDTDDELFPGLDATAVDWIELVTVDGEDVRAERTQEGWRLTRPGVFAADDVTLSGMASQLASLEIEGRVTGDAPPSDFGLAGDAPTLRFAAAGREHGLRLGKRTPVGSNTYAMAEPGDAIVYVSTWRTNALRKRLADLRDRRVLDFDHAAIDRIEVRWPDGGVSLEKTGEEWRLLRPVEERADRATVETLLSDLAFLRADGFVDEPLAAAESGLEDPVGTVRLAGPGPSGDRLALQLDFGALRDGRRVVRGTDGTLFLVDAERLDDIPREVLAYRFKALGDYDVAEARGLALSFSVDGTERLVESTLAAGHWQTVPAPVPDARVRGIVETLSRLQAVSIVAESLGDRERNALGLDPPRVRARVTDERGELLADVRLGLHESDRGILAMRGDSPIVYRVDETVAAPLPLDAADFDARFVGEGDPPEDADEPYLAEPEDEGPTPEI